MTTIAFDGKSVAADSLQGSSDYDCKVPAVKLKVVDRVVYAITGYFAWFDAWIEWHRDGCDPNKTPVFKGNMANSGNFLVFIDRRCFVFDIELPYPDEHFSGDAFGSGRQYAIGAMQFGATAKEAVEVACRVDPGSGGEVQVIDLERGEVFGHNISVPLNPLQNFMESNLISNKRSLQSGSCFGSGAPKD